MRDPIRPSGEGRTCSRIECNRNAARTLIYIYAESTAVLGPLSTFAEPHTFDFCTTHSQRLTVPKGWKVIKHESNGQSEPTQEDLLAIADAVRNVAKTEIGNKTSSPEVGRRGHLRAIPSSND